MIRPGQIGERRMTRWFYRQRKQVFEAQTNSSVQCATVFERKVLDYNVQCAKVFEKKVLS